MTVNLRGTDESPGVTFTVPSNWFDPNHVQSMTESSYLFVAVCFMYALKSLGNPETASRGNFAGMVGMTVAICTTLTNPSFEGTYVAVACFVIAGGIGMTIAKKAEMIMMPQLVAGFHAMVGLAAVLVAFARYFDTSESMNTSHLVETMVGVFFGAVTLTGSIVACGKLHGFLPSKTLLLPFRHWINVLVITSSIYLTYRFCLVDQASTAGSMYLFVLTILSLFLGWHLVMSIGGADMPVVASMLNSYSGWTTVAAGFMLDNNLLIIAGSLIGSSGAILSYIMCKGMNRSFISVILGGFGVEEGTVIASAGGDVVEISTADLASDLINAKSVVIVPGYGMAVARCQQTVAAITESLRSNGVRVRFAIHPVAGRLPGHMNVLLAEANVPYDIVDEMDKINPDFPSTDIAIVLGANDIVNPMAVEDLSSPIGGMPVLEVWKAKKCIVMKRSMATGYSGIDNPLFYKENVKMFFGNAKDKTNELLGAIQQISKNSVLSSTTGLRDPLLLKSENNFTASIQPITYPPPTKTIGFVNESLLNDGTETRVAIAPNAVASIRKLGYGLVMESKAGQKAYFPDQYYEGVKILSNADAVIAASEIVVYIGSVPSSHQEKFKPGQVVIGYFWPAFNGDILREMASRKITSLSMDAVPRITRAQKLDTLSSMANMAGYKAVVEAFHLLPRFSKPLTTAAGQVSPAKVFIAGAGVAGLSAIGTARSMGAIVRANDTRAVVKEQVESMGAEFVRPNYVEDASTAGGYAKEMSKEFQRAQLEMYSKLCADSDVVITTALIPGKPAPRLVTKEMVRSMKPGSVIVDLAAAQGGNVELTVKDKVIVDSESGVTIVGNSNFARDMAAQASELYAANLAHLFTHMKDAKNIDSAIATPDDVIGPMRCTFNGNVVYAPPSAPVAPPTKPVVSIQTAVKPTSTPTSPLVKWISFVAALVITGGVFLALGNSSDTQMINHIMAFIMAVIIGYFIVWSVDAALHTPLMSVTNAVSGIIVIGGLLQLGTNSWFAFICAVMGSFCAGCNIFGGFLITQRMLGMFKRR
jgi:NAD(P) transhydrogenase